MQEVSSIKFNTFFGTESEFKLYRDNNSRDGNSFSVTIISKNIFQRMFNECSGKDWKTTTNISNSYDLLREELPEHIERVANEYTGAYGIHSDFSHFDELEKMMSPSYIREKEKYQSVIDETIQLINLIQYKNPQLRKSLEGKFNLNSLKDRLKDGRSDLLALQAKINRITCKLISELGFIKSYEICKPFEEEDAIGKKINDISTRCSNLGLKIPVKLHKTHETFRAEIKNIIFQIGAQLDNRLLAIDEDNRSNLTDVLEASTSNTKMSIDEVENLANKLLKGLEKLKANNPSKSPFLNLRIEDLKKFAREVGINLDATK